MLPYVNTTGYSGANGFGYPGQAGLMQRYSGFGYPGERGLMSQYGADPAASQLVDPTASSQPQANNTGLTAGEQAAVAGVGLAGMAIVMLVRGALGYYVGGLLAPPGENHDMYKYITAATFAVVGDGFIFPATIAAVAHFAHK